VILGRFGLYNFGCIAIQRFEPALAEILRYIKKKFILSFFKKKNPLTRLASVFISSPPHLCFLPRSRVVF
jgi:hypothetical protein